MTYANKPLSLTAALCAVGIFGACSDDSDSGSDGTATVDVATAQSALTAMTGAVDTTVTGFVPTANGAAATVACAGGGRANVAGRVDVVVVPVNVDVSITIDYQACQTSDGTLIDGNLEFVQTVAAGAQPLRAETIYTGQVQLSGQVQASCPVDLNVLVDETGKAVTVNGSFCGRDASELTLQIAPRWRK